MCDRFRLEGETKQIANKVILILNLKTKTINEQK